MNEPNPIFNAYIEALSIEDRAALAVKCATNMAYITQIKSGQRRPSFRLAQRLAYFTQGAIPLSSWPNPTDLRASWAGNKEIEEKLEALGIPTG